MKMQPKYGSSIVLVGDLNPAIFQPAWFGSNGLLPQGEMDSANVEMIHKDVCIFSLDWIRLQVTHDQFIATTKHENQFETLRDLILGTFSLLVHTPIRAMGINFDVVAAATNEGEWHNVGNELTPKQPWEGILKSPGMKKLTMEGKRNDGIPGYIWITVEPGPNSPPEYNVSIQINNHSDLTRVSHEPNAKSMLEVLQSTWSRDFDQSKVIFKQLAGSLI